MKLLRSEAFGFAESEVFCRFGKSEVVLCTVRIGDKKLTDIKWFKFDPHTFDTAQMRYLGGAHERGALYQLVWVKLLCEAAKCGDGGRIYIFKGRVITTRELSVIFGMDEDTVAMAVCLLTDMGLLKYDGESGLVVRDFSDYLGEGYLGAVREEESAEDCPDTEDEEAELSEEERRREYNREAKRRSRERQRQRAAEQNEDNDAVYCVKNDVKSEFDGVKSVKTDVKSVKGYVIDSVKDVKQNVKNPPKNIFIEENRIEESRIEDKRKEEIRKEENENNFLSPTLTDNSCPEDSLPQDGGYESNAAVSPQGAPPPAHAEEKEREEIRSYYGIFNNVYLSQSELTSLGAEFGDILSELIEDLSCAMESEGRSYNNHFATLLRWGKNKYAPKRRATPSGEYRKGEQASYGGAGGKGGNGGAEVQSSGKSSSYGGGEGYNRNDSSYDGFAAFSSEIGGAGGNGGNGGIGGNGDNGGVGGNGGNGGYYSRGGENSGGNYGQDSGAQKKNSYRSGYEPIRNLTREEAEEAFRRALERTAAGG